MKNIVDDFICVYVQPPKESGIATPLGRGTWMGIPFHQFVLDAFNIAEIIYETKPSVIIECGSYNGGSALFWASVMDAADIPGIVIAIDIKPAPVRRHRLWKQRVRWISGNSISPDVFKKCTSLISPKSKVMVILDSCHFFIHVRPEMELYGKLVSLGCYMIVEDGILNGHPILPRHGPGPLEAIEDYLKEHSEFVVDVARETKYIATFNPSGFLKRIGK